MMALLDDVLGRGFLLRWAKMNYCEEWMQSRLSELEEIKEQDYHF